MTRTGSGKAYQEKTEKHSLLANARDSLNWGIDALTSSNPKHAISPSPVPEEWNVSPKGISMPAPSKPKRKRLGSGNYPPKSPFPFTPTNESVEPGEPGRKFRKGFSGALRRVSGASKPSATRKTIIPNSQRAHDGPDTPMPLKSPGLMSFMKEEVMSVGNINVHFQEVVAKAKQGMAIKGATEKRRESLKKKIVVLGMTDQSPGMGSPPRRYHRC